MGDGGREGLVGGLGSKIGAYTRRVRFQELVFRGGGRGGGWDGGEGLFLRGG